MASTFIRPDRARAVPYSLLIEVPVTLLVADARLRDHPENSFYCFRDQSVGLVKQVPGFSVKPGLSHLLYRLVVGRARVERNPGQ
jgi:hypothetical protein